MKVKYMDDATAGGGHGFLEFSNVNFPAAPMSFSLLRASDHQYATGKANVWTAEKNWLPIEEAPGPDGILCIPIGPGLVNALNGQETYGITLKGADDKEFGGRLKIRDITYSADDALDNTDSSRLRNLEEKLEEPAPDKAASSASSENPLSSEKQSAAVEENTPPLAMPEPQKKNTGKYWRWLILLILLLGCFAWYFLDPRKGGQEGTSPETTAGQAAEKQGQQAGTPPQTSASTEPGEEKREESRGPKINFQGRSITPAEAAELSRTLPRQTAGEKDAIYRLYYFAANHDEPGILLDYAACLDPSLPEWGTIGKDAPLAWSIYEKAEETDKVKAEAARNHLLEWLRKNAANNRQAKIWFEEIGK